LPLDQFSASGLTYQYFQNANTSINNCTFEANDAGIGLGGGILCTGQLTYPLYITSSTVSNNRATNGGGLSMIANKLVVSGSTFSSNYALQQGGGMFLTSPISLITTMFVNNPRPYYQTQDYNFISSTIMNTVVVLSANLITRNKASSGGGVAIDEVNPNTQFISNSITDNTAQNYGGGVFALSAFTMLGDTISSNVAGNAGGIFAVGSGLNGLFSPIYEDKLLPLINFTYPRLIILKDVNIQNNIVAKLSVNATLPFFIPRISAPFFHIRQTTLTSGALLLNAPVLLENVSESNARPHYSFNCPRQNGFYGFPADSVRVFNMSCASSHITAPISPTCGNPCLMPV